MSKRVPIVNSTKIKTCGHGYIESMSASELIYNPNLCVLNFEKVKDYRIRKELQFNKRNWVEDF